jgi:hypothetical protein
MLVASLAGSLTVQNDIHCSATGCAPAPIRIDGRLHRVGGKMGAC